MTYLLDNTQKAEILKSNSIKFNRTTNTIFIGSLDVTNINDENFYSIVLDYNLSIDNITGVSTSDLLVDYVRVTPSIKNSLKDKFSTLEEVKEYCKKLTYSIIYLYSIEGGFTKIKLNN